MSESGGGFFPWKLQKLQLRSATPTTADATTTPSPSNHHSSSQDKQEPQPQPRLAAAVAATAAKSPPPKAKQQVVPNLVTEEKAVIDNMPPLFPKASSKHTATDDWEFLSDKVSSSGNNSSCRHTCTNSHHHHGGGSSSSINNDGVLVAKAGSVRSIASFDDGQTGSAAFGANCNGSHTTSSVPFKFQRTHSSSTIDSTDHTFLGPSGKGVLGVDYVEHVILPTDTLQGICLAYKINATRLKQANHFSGNSLSLAPKKLVIPLSTTALRSGYIRSQDTDAKEYKLHALLAEYPKLTLIEAKAHLELADWVLKDALQSVKEDYEWDAEIDASSRKSGEIRISVKGGVLSAQGAGIPKRLNDHGTNTATNSNLKEPTSEKIEKTKVTAYAAAPVISSKTIKAADVYWAEQQHDNAGVELKPLNSKRHDTTK